MNSMRPRRWRGLRGLAVGTTASLLLVACSGSEQGGMQDDDVTFSFALSAAPKSLDITKNFNAVDLGIMALFTEPLERLGSDGTLTPNLAEQVSEPDDTTIVYTLRDDVQFSNGDPLTATDVVWSIEHVTDVEGGAQTSSILSSVASAEETGPLEVTVTLSAPDPTIRQTLALVTLIQNAEVADGVGDDLGTPAGLPIGTGPYQVTDYESDQVSLTRNPNYWGERPLPEELSFVAISTANTAQLAMRSGEIHGVVVDDTSTMPQWESINGSTVYAAPQLLANYMVLDTTVAPFDDIHVRKAIAHAIDREGVLLASSGDFGSVLNTLFAPETLVPLAPSPDAVEEFLAGIPTYDFDMRAAADELAQSSHPDGFSATATYVNELPWSKLTVLNLQENLRPLGVTIEPKAISRQQWVDSLSSHETTEIWPMSLAHATADPKDLHRIVTEEAITAAGGYNFAKWAPAELAEPAAIVASAADPSARWDAATTILAEVAADVPYVPLFQPQFVVVLGEGFSFTDAPGLIDLSSGSWISKLEGK